MPRKTQARGASTRPQDTSTLLWLGGGALGVTAIILGLSALTPSSTGQPTKTPITAKAKSAAVANSASATDPPSLAQSASQNPGRTQQISQRPALMQPPKLVQPARQTQGESEPPILGEPPQSALAAYFYDLQVHRTDRDDFVQGIMDSEVTWVGYIRTVRPKGDATTLLMVAIPSNDTFDIAYIDFPQAFNEKLSDLAVMDKVRIKGFYRGGGPMPHVDGTSVELVEE